jgi:hypothetical protein
MDGLMKLIAENLSYGWFVLMAFWGGTANYISRRNRDKTPFSIIELVGEWSVSGFAGLITAYICMDMGLSFALTSAAAGIGGHMGGRAIYLFEQIFIRRTGGTAGKGGEE